VGELTKFTTMDLFVSRTRKADTEKTTKTTKGLLTPPFFCSWSSRLSGSAFLKGHS